MRADGRRCFASKERSEMRDRSAESGAFVSCPPLTRKKLLAVRLRIFHFWMRGSFDSIQRFRSIPHGPTEAESGLYAFLPDDR